MSSTLRTSDSVDATQLWTEAFFFAMDRMKVAEVGNADRAADFADQAVARFNKCLMIKAESNPQPQNDPYRTLGARAMGAEGVAAGSEQLSELIQKELSGDRGIRGGDFEGHPLSPGPGTLGTGAAS